MNYIELKITREISKDYKLYQICLFYTVHVVYSELEIITK